MKYDDLDLSIEAIRHRLSEPVPPDDRVYIAAKNFSQARWHAMHAGLSSKQWVYVSSERSLRGRRPGFRYWLVGEWIAHRDAVEILKVLDYLMAVRWDPTMEQAA